MIESADWKLGKTNAVEGFYTVRSLSENLI